MLPSEFILTDLHFAITMLAALACFATFWLYLDAWIGEGRRMGRDFWKAAGYGVLAVGLMVAATEVDASFIGETWFNQVGLVGLVLRGLGYGILAIALFFDKLQPVPTYDQPAAPAVARPAPSPSSAPVAAAPPIPALASAPPLPPIPPPPSVPVVPPVVDKPPTIVGGWMTGGVAASQTILPVLAGAVAFLYWRRATKGLERHLKPVAWAFTWLTMFELLGLVALVRGADDPRIYDLVATFGPVWMLQYIVLFTAAIILGRWVWRYLTKRFQTQLFIVFTTACMLIFLITTVSFTFLLMGRIQAQSFDSLKTTARVMHTAIGDKQAGTLAAAQVVAENPQVIAAVVAHDHARLASLTKDVLVAKRQSTLVITSDSAQVLLRAEDPVSWGDSISSDTQVSRASIGKNTSGLVASQGSATSRLTMRSTVPIRNTSGSVVGTVTAGFAVDNAFVDGLEHDTGLAVGMYSGAVRVATTLRAADGTARSVGARESNAAITDTVLKHNRVWSGNVARGGQAYLSVYTPLHDVDNEIVGMLFIGQPQTLLLQAAGQSIELTFLIAVALLLLSIVPVHLLSKSLAGQLH